MDPILEKVRETGAWSGELTGVRTDGTPATLEWSAVRVVGQQGQECAVATCADITERKNEEELLRRNEEQFRRMVDSLPQMICMSGVDRKCFYFNHQWLEFTGRTASEEEGHGWTLGIHPDDRASANQAFQEAFEHQKPCSHEHRHRRFDGQYRWMQFRGLPRLDEHGQFVGYIGSCVDITDQKNAREQLQEKREELADATRVSTIGEMATALAHELNQPLAALAAYANGCCNILERGGDDLVDQLRSPLTHISAQAKRAADIIRSLRALVRRRRSSHASHDVVALVNGVLPVFAMESNKRAGDVKIEHLHEPTLPSAKCDPVLIEQVLLNLLRNSVEAVNDVFNRRRQILVKTVRSGDEKIKISVSDSGAGMSEVVRDRAFNPFFSTKSEGMGMGLAICQSIIEEHGGSLSVCESSLGGATISFTLPISS